VRSVSGNIYIGKGNGWASGPWGGAGGPNNMTIYRGASKAADLLIPGPSRTWVYVDEHPDSINDAGCFPSANATTFTDAPATYHNGASGFSFADGHSEIHKWKGRTMTGRLRNVIFNEAIDTSTYAGDPDVYWYSFASPRNSTMTVAGP
jgi:prepilin-type processing-associated H-X9-DG protein